MQLMLQDRCLCTAIKFILSLYKLTVAVTQTASVLHNHRTFAAESRFAATCPRPVMIAPKVGALDVELAPIRGLLQQEQLVLELQPKKTSHFTLITQCAQRYSQLFLSRSLSFYPV